MPDVMTEDTAEPSKELVSKVEAGLAKIGTDDAPTGTEPTPEPDPEPEPEPTPEPDVKEPAGEPDPEPEPDTAGEPRSEPEPEAGAEKTAPTLPDNYIRAAKHQGWEDEDIKEFFESNPEQAIKTLAKIYATNNTMSNQFAELGKTLHEKGKSALDIDLPQGLPRSEQPGAKVAAEVVKSEFKGIDIEAIKAQYGDDDPIVALIQQQDNTARQQFDKIAELSANMQAQASPERADREADYALEQNINTFFSGEAVKDFDDIYGVGDSMDDDLTGRQAQNRWRVIQMADQMIAGAMLQRKELSISDALELSHLAITAPEKEKIIRNELKAKATKRQKGKSLKPSSHKTVPVKQTAAQKDANMESRVAAKLAKAFI